MSRRKLKKKRPIQTDPVLQSLLIQMITNRLLKKGKKRLAFKIILNALAKIKTRSKQESTQILELAIQNLSPSLEIQTKRIGGAVYSIPVEIHSFRSTNLAIQLLLGAIKSKSGKSLDQKLADEILEASQNTGIAIRKKEELQRLAESNSKLTKK